MHIPEVSECDYKRREMNTGNEFNDATILNGNEINEEEQNTLRSDSHNSQFGNKVQYIVHDFVANDFVANDVVAKYVILDLV